MAAKRVTIRLQGRITGPSGETCFYGWSDQTREVLVEQIRNLICAFDAATGERIGYARLGEKPGRVHYTLDPSQRLARDDATDVLEQLATRAGWYTAIAGAA